MSHLVSINHGPCDLGNSPTLEKPGLKASQSLRYITSFPSSPTLSLAPLI